MSAGVGIHPALATIASAVEDVRKVAAMLTADEVWTFTDADLEFMVRAQSELDSAVAAVGVRAVREADVRGLSLQDGKISTAVWLGQKLNLHPVEARQRVKDADILSRKGIATVEALAEGKLNRDQARAVGRSLRKIEPVGSASELAKVETFLLAKSHGADPGAILRLGRHIEEVIDEDGKPPAPDPDDPTGDAPAESKRAARAQRKRSLTITDLGNGLHRIRGELTDEVAALVKAALDPLAAPRPAVNGVRDERSAPQRRHDALGDVFRQFLRFGDLPPSHGVRPHLHVTASVETMKGDTGHPFARTATPAQWAALVARDIGCIGEGCTRPAAWCEAHHIEWWDRDEGPTDVDKMALVCSHEHYLIRSSPRRDPPQPLTALQGKGWGVRMAADGHPEMIPPKWVDSEQTPRRNAHWQLIRNGLKVPPEEPEPPPPAAPRRE
ncbi:HNH endonuclease signature motif containing protein [Sporichthya polymorpha]|uniref:HNH endonuclease signature motif containing protein n=1 Tax=Sporichthya polymorpha TaxID=35751 RepID=UPI0003A8E491|nr:HNH endonuclease signature motif containing protein [Sporichthya polymorpha]